MRVAAAGMVLFASCAAEQKAVVAEPSPVVELSATAELSAADTEHVIHAHLPELQSCVDTLLHPAPGTHGKIVVQFHVQQSGQTSDVAVRGDVPPSLSVCLAEVFTAMRFRRHRSDPEPVIWPMKY